MPNRRAGETEREFVSRYMHSTKAKRHFPDRAQRLAVAINKARRGKKGKYERKG